MYNTVVETLLISKGCPSLFALLEAFVWTGPGLSCGLAITKDMIYNFVVRKDLLSRSTEPKCRYHMRVVSVCMFERYHRSVYQRLMEVSGRGPKRGTHLGAWQCYSYISKPLAHLFSRKSLPLRCLYGFGTSLAALYDYRNPLSSRHLQHPALSFPAHSHAFCHHGLNRRPVHHPLGRLPLRRCDLPARRLSHPSLTPTSMCCRTALRPSESSDTSMRPS
jgi:hypothetical protein